ncbi:MAG TPA: outer membrane protein assembly factor BamD [Candidatus Acidoferrales bacterium]|nr:outer membrane protein assembly factor BamD [Candidatus Acidoferrales bacterium]
MTKRHILIAGLLFTLAGTALTSAYGQKKPKITKVKSTPAQTKDATAESAEPDKVLYNRAMFDIKHSKYTEARLSLQTLINTYPDSEYLAKAKLAVADSFYKEGGTSNLTQAVEEYKNFIVFFPFLDEAAYAQMQVGMAHYRMMEKSDRDTSHAEAAEDEFRAFILKYPQSPLVPQADQYLRNVQEILADGEYRIARFYFLKRDYRASAARLVEMTGRYPLYSQSDQALWMLGDVYVRAKQLSRNEDDKNHWADLAAQCYDRIVRDYPLSSLAGPAADRLKSMAMPVPAADPQAVAQMQKQREYERHHHENAVLKLPLGMIKSTPDVYSAARSGQPNLNPPDDTVSATEVLNQGAAGPSFTVATAGAAGGGDAGGTNTESVDPGPDAPAPAPANPPVASAVPESSTVPAATSDPTPNAESGNAAANSTASQSAASTTESSQAAPATNSQASAQSAPAKSDSKTESTSKKKKGLRKVVPW